MSNETRIGPALTAINQSAHRSNPGICKQKLALKQIILDRLAKMGLLCLVGTQVVNDRPCYLLKLKDEDFTFHCPIDKLPESMRTHDNTTLETLPALEKEKWAKPGMSFAKAHRQCEAVVGRLPYVKLLRCPTCHERWRYDLVDRPTTSGAAMRRDWAKRTMRTCPDCYSNRQYDDWNDDEDSEDDDWDNVDGRIEDEFDC